MDLATRATTSPPSQRYRATLFGAQLYRPCDVEGLRQGLSQRRTPNDKGTSSTHTSLAFGAQKNVQDTKVALLVFAKATLRTLTAQTLGTLGETQALRVRSTLYIVDRFPLV